MTITLLLYNVKLSHWPLWSTRLTDFRLYCKL